MKNRARLTFVLCVVSASLVLPFLLVAQTGERVWSFDRDTPGRPPRASPQRLPEMHNRAVGGDQGSHSAVPTQCSRPNL
jgi:hypothetical protein